MTRRGTHIGKFTNRYGHTDEHRFGEKCWYDPATGCIEWMAYKNQKGYGTIGWKGRNSYAAHRMAYEISKGDIPDGLQIDHLCRNRSCVNPEHLEAVTPRENWRRGESRHARNARKTHCKRGHPLTGSNLSPGKLRRGIRECVKCKRAKNLISEADRRARRRAERRARDEAQRTNQA